MVLILEDKINLATPECQIGGMATWSTHDHITTMYTIMKVKEELNNEQTRRQRVEENYHIAIQEKGKIRLLLSFKG